MIDAPMLVALVTAYALQALGCSVELHALYDEREDEHRSESQQHAS